MADHGAETKRFAPKVAVQLDPPKDDPITMEELSKCDGMSDAAGRVEMRFQPATGRWMMMMMMIFASKD